MNLNPTKLNVTVRKAQKCYVLAQPTVPTTVDAPAELQAGVLAAEEMLFKIGAAAPSLVRDNTLRLAAHEPAALASYPPIAALRHRLGNISSSRLQDQGKRGMSWRSDIEQTILDQRVDSLLHSLDVLDAGAFMAELLIISAMVRGLTTTTFRKGAIRVASDKYGWYWSFPDPGGIQECLTSLHRVLHQKSFSSPVIEATVAYGILNWMHSFSDGNGRTSRIVFNALLRRGGMPCGHYLPIKEINHLAHGGHEIRLRYTSATSDWRELLEYFVNALALYKMLLHQGDVFTSCETQISAKSMEFKNENIIRI